VFKCSYLCKHENLNKTVHDSNQVRLHALQNTAYDKQIFLVSWFYWDFKLFKYDDLKFEFALMPVFDGIRFADFAKNWTNVHCKKP